MAKILNEDLLLRSDATFSDFFGIIGKGETNQAN
jgi:hypothetical protein